MFSVSKIKRDILVQMLSWRTLEKHLTEHQRKKDLKLSSFNIYAVCFLYTCTDISSPLCFLWKILSVFGRLSNICHS